MSNLIHITDIIEPTQFASLEQLSAQKHQLILSQDGIYNYPQLKLLAPLVLEVDATARNVDISNNSLVSYAEFVELSLKYDAVIKW